MISDSTLKQRVLDELRWDTRVNEAHIGVAVNDGSVTLTGQVALIPEKSAAVATAKRVRGVKAIADEIEVHIPSEHRRDDSEIAKRIAHILHWNASIPDSDLQAEVDHGHVTLTGEVEWRSQRLQVSQQVERVAGVRGLSNQITLKTRPTWANVSLEISNALHRNLENEMDNIKVSVSGDKVTLEGEVRDFHQRDLVEDAVWSAPGVRYVIDNIRIK